MTSDLLINLIADSPPSRMQMDAANGLEISTVSLQPYATVQSWLLGLRIRERCPMTLSAELGCMQQIYVGVSVGRDFVEVCTPSAVCFYKGLVIDEEPLGVIQTPHVRTPSLRADVGNDATQLEPCLFPK